jgi:hypothetical protein
MDADDHERPQGEPDDPALEGVLDRTRARIRDWLVQIAGESLAELESSLAALSAALQHPDAEMREAALYLSTRVGIARRSCWTPAFIWRRGILRQTYGDQR